MMDIKTFTLCLILLTNVDGAQEARIFPYPTATVLEGQNLTLTCTWLGSEDVVEVMWNENGNFMGSISKKCYVTGELSRATNFSVECGENNSFAITLKKLERNKHNNVWNCVIVTGGKNITSENTTTYVQVGISSVAMLTPSPMKVLADTNVSLHFQTSLGRPYSEMSCETQGDIGFADGQSEGNYTADGMSTTIGTLTLSPTRENNTVVVYCTASNVGQEFNTSEVIIDVLYSPEEPECQNRGEIVKGVIVIQEGNELCVTCTSRSNPPAYYYNWTTPKNMTIVSSNFCIPLAQMDDSGLYQLSVGNIMTPTYGLAVEGQNSTSFTVDVLWPVPQPQSNQTLWIAGGVIGGLVGTIIFAVIAICIRKNIRTRKNVSPHE